MFNFSNINKKLILILMISSYIITVLAYCYRPANDLLIIAIILITLVSKIGASFLLHKITIDNTQKVIKLRYTFFTRKVRIDDIHSWGIRSYSARSISSYFIEFKTNTNSIISYPISFSESTDSGVKKYIGIFEKELSVKRVGLNKVDTRGTIRGQPFTMYLLF